MAVLDYQCELALNNASSGRVLDPVSLNSTDIKHYIEVKPGGHYKIRGRGYEDKDGGEAGTIYVYYSQSINEQTPTDTL